MSATSGHPGARSDDLRERIANAPTPTKLRAFMYAVWAIAAVLFTAGGLMLYGAWNALKTVGLDTAPSIIYAQEISSALADLDANAGNYLLGNRQHQAAADKAFDERRVTVTTRLVKAAKNITYEAEEAPINALFDNLGRYLELVAQMRYRRDSGDAAGALAVYVGATDVMHQKMLPAADALDKANFDFLEREYQVQVFRSGGAEIIVGFIVAVLAAVLVWAQVFLTRKTRRIFNVPLALATVVTVVFGVYLVSTISEARHALKVAKEDAFDSIHALWQASAVAYDANGDESRYLLGGARAASFEQAYRDKVKKLTSMPQLDEATSAVLRRDFAKADVPRAYTGYFAEEMRNITFAGERQAALSAVRTFADYDKIDTRIRAAERAGRHADAVELCIGTGNDESNAAFDRFDKALKAVIEINHKEFDAHIGGGMRSLHVAGFALPVAALLVSFLALFGIRQRLREYAA